MAGTLVRRTDRPSAACSVHRSVTELERDFREWINEWNADLKPFISTATADDILETFAAYCQRTNDSRHY